MSNFDDLSPDELAAARFDSELPDEVAARVDANPELAELVTEQESAADFVRNSPTPAPADDMRERHLAAALAAFDELHGADETSADETSADESSALAATGAAAGGATLRAVPDADESSEVAADADTSDNNTSQHDTTRRAEREVTPPPASLQAARNRRRNPGVWIASAAAALLLVVGAGFVIANAGDDGGDASETAGETFDASASDSASGDDGASDDGGDDAAFDDASGDEAASDDGGDLDVAASPAPDGDEGSAATTAVAESRTDDDAAMEERDSLLEDEPANDAAQSDDGSSDDDDGSDDAAEATSGSGLTGPSMQLADFFAQADLERQPEPVPCLEEIVALHEERFGDEEGELRIVADPGNPDITVFLFETLDPENPEPIAGYAVNGTICQPIDQVLFD